MNTLILLTMGGCLSPALERELDARKIYDPYPAAYTPFQEIAAYALENGEKVTLVNGHSAYLVSELNDTIVRYEINGFPNYYLDDALQFTKSTLPYWCIDNALDGFDGIVFKAGPATIMDARERKIAHGECNVLLTTTQEYINSDSLSNRNGTTSPQKSIRSARYPLDDSALSVLYHHPL